MNFTEINHCLTTAINNLAEGEIDVAALAMAEDLEREEIEEATKRKNTQRARDRRAFKKYGVKFRNTDSGHTIAINKRGKVVGGNPNVLEKIPAEKKATPPKKSAKKSPADKLRAQLAKAKKKMGKSFNAMLAQSDDTRGNLTEKGYGPEPSAFQKKLAQKLWKQIMEQGKKVKVGPWKLEKLPSGKGIRMIGDGRPPMVYDMYSMNDLLDKTDRLAQYV